MKRPYQIASLVLICLAAYFCIESLKMRYYTSFGPGPGFFPMWLSILLAILAVVMFWKATFGRPEPMPADFYADRRGYLRIGAILVALIAVVVLMKPLGFRLTMMGFYLFLLTTLGCQYWPVTLIITLGGSFGVYHLFVHLFGTPLPIGMFGF